MIAGTTVAFISSLIFNNVQIKRKRQWELEDSAPKPPPPEPEPEPIIYPFLDIRVGTPCPKCLRPTKNAVIKNYGTYSVVTSSAEGCHIPEACNDNKCKARKKFHLHVRCNTCKGSWFMEPADSKKNKKEEKKCPPDTPTK